MWSVADRIIGGSSASWQWHNTIKCRTVDAEVCRPVCRSLIDNRPPVRTDQTISLGDHQLCLDIVTHRSHTFAAKTRRRPSIWRYFTNEQVVNYPVVARLVFRATKTVSCRCRRQCITFALDSRQKLIIAFQLSTSEPAPKLTSHVDDARCDCRNRYSPLMTVCVTIWTSRTCYLLQVTPCRRNSMITE